MTLLLEKVAEPIDTQNKNHITESKEAQNCHVQ